MLLYSPNLELQRQTQFPSRCETFIQQGSDGVNFQGSFTLSAATSRFTHSIEISQLLWACWDENGAPRAFIHT